MQLAACYIVKNEAKELDQSIHSLRHAVEELVIVDTGSKDNTVEIAKSYGAKIFHFPWQDHFAKARNFALAHVESPWIIFLDADEYFRHPMEIQPAIQELLKGQPQSDAILLLRYNIDIDHQGKILPYDISLRILRNAPELHYQGRIHEMLRNRLGQLNTTHADERLALIHTGYSSLRNTNKIQRNLTLLEKEVAENGRTPFHSYNQATCYFGLKNYKKALILALDALDSNLTLVSGQGDLYHIAIESMRQLDMPLEDMLSLAQAAIRELPELPEFYGECGIILSAMGHLEEAYNMLKKAMDIYDHQKVNYRQGSYFTTATAAIVCKRLGEIQQILGQPEKARQWFQRAKSLLSPHRL